MHSGQSFQHHFRWGILHPLLLLARRKTQVAEVYSRHDRADLPEPHPSASVNVSVDWYRRGEALANKKLYAAALDSFDQALACDPEAADAWVFRGVMLIHLEQYEAALASCERSLAIAPHHQEAWLFRGVALHRLGRYQQAYHSYKQAAPNP